jgi:hypothetical protein
VLARFSAALARIDADERDAEVAAVATASASGADSNTTVQQDGANSNTTILQQDVDHVNEQHSAYEHIKRSDAAGPASTRIHADPHTAQLHARVKRLTYFFPVKTSYSGTL